MDIEDEVWKRLKFSSSYQVENNLMVRERYLTVLKKELQRAEIKTVGLKTQLILESENYHTLNQALSFLRIGDAMFKGDW